MGGEAAQIRYRAAEYAMCALADEIALGANWPGRNEWLERLLETERFGSQAAGERLFQLMDAMLACGLQGHYRRRSSE
jgi:type VI protein secretion system component VasF